jgi:CRP/FNR family transcriptional regulator, cyclic AMP receptor protein
VSALAAATASASASRPPRTVALLRADERLREAIPDHELRFAQRVLIVPRHELDRGSWDPETLLEGTVNAVAAVVLHGLVTHELALGGRLSANLLGPGDVFRPWRGADTGLPCAARWTATAGTTIAVLDERFVASARRWPGLSTVVYERLAEQLDDTAIRAAIVALPRIEVRVLALFWQLADRWGIVTPDGIVVRLALTHAMIGELVGAQRPTVSLALQALAEAGDLRRATPGTWTLSRASHAKLAANGAVRVDVGRPVSADLPRSPFAGAAREQPAK